MEHAVAPESFAVARLIRMQMAIRGVSQTPLAKKLGISQSTLSRKLKGKKRFEFDEILIACEFLGLDAGKTIAQGIHMAEAQLDTGELSIINAGPE